MDKHNVVESGSLTQGVVRLSPTTASGNTVAVMVPARRSKRRNEDQGKRIENAVYAYIRAVRALGRTEVNTAEISKALRLPLKETEQAASRLASKGVKVA